MCLFVVFICLFACLHVFAELIACIACVQCADLLIPSFVHSVIYLLIYSRIYRIGG